MHRRHLRSQCRALKNHGINSIANESCQVLVHLSILVTSGLSASKAPVALYYSDLTLYTISMER